MPKVHKVIKARKANKAYGIQKGDTYYWWCFYKSGKSYSVKYPKPSQLTRSEFLSPALALQEQFEAIATEIKADDREDIASQLETMADELEALGEEQADRLSNMPEQLQEGETGQMMQERADQAESTAGELRDAAEEVRNVEPEEVEDEDTDDDDIVADDNVKVSDTVDISDALNGVNWSF